MKDAKFFIGTLVGSVILLVGGLLFLITKPASPKLDVTAQATASVDSSAHDWGDIGINDGKVTKEFKIKNPGTSTLQLKSVATSCMCTTAQVTINGQNSPYFGMHSKSSWIGEIEPGSQALLKVEYDPAFHGPSGVGAITRQVSLETNDANNPKLTFNLSANVIK